MMRKENTLDSILTRKDHLIYYFIVMFNSHINLVFVVNLACKDLGSWMDI